MSSKCGQTSWFFYTQRKIIVNEILKLWAIAHCVWLAQCLKSNDLKPLAWNNMPQSCFGFLREKGFLAEYISWTFEWFPLIKIVVINSLREKGFLKEFISWTFEWFPFIKFSLINSLRGRRPKGRERRANEARQDRTPENPSCAHFDFPSFTATQATWSTNIPTFSSVSLLVNRVSFRIRKILPTKDYTFLTKIPYIHHEQSCATKKRGKSRRD